MIKYNTYSIKYNNMDNNIPTKSQIKTTDIIKVNPDNFSWSVVDAEIQHPKLILKCIKTAKLKKLEEINQMDKEDGVKSLNLSDDMLKTFEILLGSELPENQIFFQKNVKNISNAFIQIINVIKN